MLMPFSSCFFSPLIATGDIAWRNHSYVCQGQRNAFLFVHTSSLSHTRSIGALFYPSHWWVDRRELFFCSHAYMLPLVLAT